MPELSELIKKAALDAVETEKPMAVIFGKITSVRPIRVRLEQGVEIDEAFLIKTESSVDRIEIGNRVVLIRMQGGQQFLLIDRLVD